MSPFTKQKRRTEANKFINRCTGMEGNLRNPFRGILDKKGLKIFLQSETAII